MFKFFKELLDSAKEGWEEGKEELKAEKEVDELANPTVDTKAIALAVPCEEAFGTALAAPFRILITSDWMTIFKSSPQDADYPPHL